MGQIVFDFNGKESLVISAKTLWWVVDGANIEPDSIDTASIKANAITTSKISNNAVTTAKINNGAVTDAKITSMAFTKITGGTITNATLILDTATWIIQSNNYVSGTAWWILKWDWNMETNRLYLDSTHYLYRSWNDIYWYDGTTGIKLN